MPLKWDDLKPTLSPFRHLPKDLLSKYQLILSLSLPLLYKVHINWRLFYSSGHHRCRHCHENETFRHIHFDVNETFVPKPRAASSIRQEKFTGALRYQLSDIHLQSVMAGMYAKFGVPACVGIVDIKVLRVNSRDKELQLEESPGIYAYKVILSYRWLN